MARKLRVLVFMYHTRHFGTALGGAERRILQLSLFSRQNIESYFLEKEPSIAHFYSPQPSHTVWMPNSGHGIPARLQALIWTIGATLSAMKLNREHTFDLLVSHDPEYWNVLPMLLTARIIGRSCAAYLHHTERTNERKLAQTLRDFHLYFRSLGNRNITSLLSAFEKILSVTLLRRLDFLIAVSNTTKRDFIHRGVPERKLYVVANGINVGYLSKFYQPAKKFDCAYFGRISPRKGLDDLIYVLEKLPSKKALIIGGGSPRHVEHYRRLFDRLSNVEFAGYLHDDEAYRSVSSSRLLVFPSYEEGFGLVVGEAMAMGIPVICYDVPALVEVWDEAAQFVKTGDRQALLEHVHALLNDEDRLGELAAKGMKYVTNYDWPLVVAREVEVLKNALGR